jgi:hypothetical protein
VRNESVLVGVAALRQDELTRAARAGRPRVARSSNRGHVRAVWTVAALVRAAAGAAAGLVLADSAGSGASESPAQEILR